MVNRPTTLMKPAFYLVCLRYAPGNWQHMESFARCLLGNGYPVRFLISSGFQWMNTAYTRLTTYTPFSNSPLEVLKHSLAFVRRGSSFRDLFQKDPPSGVLLVMWHPLNFLLARFIKSLYPDIPILAWMHEPYKDDKRIYGLKAPLILLMELVQSLSLPYIDVVILHSSRALRLFRKRYPHFPNQTQMVPLQFQDHGFAKNPLRQFISFLGRADRAKGIDAFFALVENSTKTQPRWRYQIITSSSINNYLMNLSPSARENLQVVNNSQITDGDLRDAASSSLAVLALYKETMQSGVIPLALMKGTPVIGTNIEGITEWIQDRETGVIVSSDPSIKEIENAGNYIFDHFQEMSGACRAAYLANFDDLNWPKHYGWLTKLLSEQHG
jgi:glycosyltransferase involved in cell wall biosynthesis